MSDAQLTAEAEESPGAALWRRGYAALGLNLLWLAWMIQWPRHGGEWVWGLAPVAVIAPLAWFANGIRLLMHDYLVDLAPRERTLVWLAGIAAWLSPAFFRNYHVMTDGVLWLACYLLLLAARPAGVRAFLCATLGGAFMAAWRLESGAAEGGLWFGFGASWVFALGMTHMAQVGQAHGLDARWALRRAAGNAGWAALAGAAGGWLAWWFWPAGGMHPEAMGRGTRLVKIPPPSAAVKRIEPGEMMNLLWQGLFTVLLIALMIVLLVLLRRWLLKRMRGGVMAQMLPGQVSELLYAEVPEEGETRVLEGRRGQMLAQWTRWARGMAAAGVERRAEETARQFAVRVKREEPGLAAPAELTLLMERAHYGAGEPEMTEVRRMEELVNGELGKAKHGSE